MLSKSFWIWAEGLDQLSVPFGTAVDDQAQLPMKFTRFEMKRGATIIGLLSVARWANET
jgi:hypothetical protein